MTDDRRNDADVPADDRSFLYGDGLFETVRVEEDGPVWLDYHVERFRKSARALSYAEGTIDDAIEELEALRDAEPGLWRVTVSRPGRRNPWGGSGCIRVRYREFPEVSRPHLGLARGFYVPDDFFAEFKTTSFGRKATARIQGAAEGYDDVIMTSRDGRIGEATAANVIVVVGGEVITPPVEGILPGTTRRFLLERSAEVGAPVDVRPIRESELMSATEVVLTSAGVGVLAAASLLERELNDDWAQTAAAWLEDAW